MVTSAARSLVIRSLRNATIHNNQQYHPPNNTTDYYITEVDAALAGHSSLVAPVQR